MAGVITASELSWIAPFSGLSPLVGYAVACNIHENDESFDFWNSGPFSQWLWKRTNMAHLSNLG